MAQPDKSWQPIETAPKDGTSILVYSEKFGYRLTRKSTFHRPMQEWQTAGWRVVEAFWTGEKWQEWLGEGVQSTGAESPTHWKPCDYPKQSKAS